MWLLENLKSLHASHCISSGWRCTKALLEEARVTVSASEGCVPWASVWPAGGCPSPRMWAEDSSCSKSWLDRLVGDSSETEIGEKAPCSSAQEGLGKGYGVWRGKAQWRTSLSLVVRGIMTASQVRGEGRRSLRCCSCQTQNNF